MKQTRRLALALLVTSLAATPALSASMTMLQFGSFETRDEAQKRLSEVSSKHADSIGKLPTSIREVKLPPDNLTVYRTQAGPVADRAAAQSLCSKLATAGDECYIVQTAMVATPAAPAVATAPTSAISAELEKAKTDAVASTGSTPDLTSKLSTINSDVAARDASNRAALNSVNTSLASNETPSAAMSPLPTPPAEPSPEMKAALDKAVADQPKVAADLNATTAAADTQTPTKRSFWSRMNPFSSAAPAAAVAAAPSPNAAPVEAVASQNIEAPIVAQPTIAASAAPVEASASVAPVVVQQQPIVAAQPMASAQPAAGFSNAPVIMQAEPMRLPPPPAPLKAQDRDMLTAAKAPNAAPESVAQPITVAPLPPTAGVNANGTVQVEEAKRVPLTEATNAPVVAQAVPLAAPFQQAPVSLRPSATDGRKTIWAQIGPFHTKDEALAFWNNYRQNYPDFPVVRTRVVSSFQQELNGTGMAWLRIGPVAQAGFVRNLCASLLPTKAQTPALRCGMVADLGISSPIRPTTNGLLPTSRYTKR